MKASKLDNFTKLTKEANQTFYQLYGMELDFKDRYLYEIDDDAKFLRVIININTTTSNENYDTFELKKENFSYDIIVPENISITLFGRTYNLKEEYQNLCNSIFHFTNVTKIVFYNNNFDAIGRYELYVNNNVGTINVIIEDKDDKYIIEQDLETFWNSVKDLVPEEYIGSVRYAAKFVAITFGIRRVVENNREKLVQIANETFYNLYNISLEFQGKNMIISNEEGRYYKVIINEYPKYEGEIFTKIIIKNSRVIYNDFPIFSALTFKIFGRIFNLKEEFLSIMHLLSPIIKDGFIRIEKMNLDEFDSQIINKYELIKENEESQGGYEIVFEDKDDRREIKYALNDFWMTWSKQIPKQDEKEAKLISQFVVTTFGIWHSIQNRYDKIVVAAKESLYQLLNLTIDFEGKYIFDGRNDVYELLVLIDEYPLEPSGVETYFNITDGRAYFPKISDKPYSQIKLDISGELLDVEEEFKLFGNIFASGMRNGKVFIYKKNTETVSNIIRFKCFVNSQNNEEYGAFEISIKYIEKTKWQIIKGGISKFWEEVKNVLGELNEALKIVSEMSGIIVTIKENLIKIIPNPSNHTSSFSSYLGLNIPLIILIYLLF